MTVWGEDSVFTSGAVGQPVRVEPSDAVRAQGLIAGQSVKVQHLNHVLNELDAARGMFGDGSDGDVAPAPGVTTLTRDMYYNDLTIGASVQLATAGYRIFVLGTLSIANNGTLRANGSNGGNAAASTGGSAGAGAPVGTLAGGSNGGAGVSGAAGNNGGDQANAVGGSGGDAGSGGDGGVATPPLASVGGWRDSGVWRLAATVDGTPLRGGCGGGSGTSAGGTAASGGAGGGGGLLVAYAYRISVEAGGEILANGGNAGTSFEGGGSAAGSGGGGPGRVVLLCRAFSNAGTIECEGGAPSVGVGGGADGSTPVGTTPLVFRV